MNKNDQLLLEDSLYYKDLRRRKCTLSELEEEVKENIKDLDDPVLFDYASFCIEEAITAAKRFIEKYPREGTKHKRSMEYFEGISDVESFIESCANNTETEITLSELYAELDRFAEELDKEKNDNHDSDDNTATKVSSQTANSTNKNGSNSNTRPNVSIDPENGFNQVPHDLWDNSDFRSLGSSGKIVLLYMCDLSNRFGRNKKGVFSVGQRELGKIAKCSQPNVVKIIKKLEDLGFIEVVTKGAYRGNTSTYRILF